MTCMVGQHTVRWYDENVPHTNMRSGSGLRVAYAVLVHDTELLAGPAAT
jgi:hypothetical protein